MARAGRGPGGALRRGRHGIGSGGGADDAVAGWVGRAGGAGRPGGVTAEREGDGDARGWGLDRRPRPLVRGGRAGAELGALPGGTHPGPAGRSPAGPGLAARSGPPPPPAQAPRRSCTARDRQGPRTEGRDPQEARHEQDTCRHGEGEPPPRDRRATRGRGQDPPDELYGNRLLLRPAPGLQDVGAQAVQDPRHTLGVADHGLEGSRREDRPPRQGHLGHVLADIRQALRRGEGLDRGVEPEALRYLVVLPALQVLLEGRLADQHQLQRERAGRGRVRQLPHLLEGFEGQVLRLVDNECHIPTQVRLVEEALLDLRPQGPEIIRRHRHRQTAGQQGKNVHKGVARLPEHQRGEVRRTAAR